MDHLVRFLLPLHVHIRNWECCSQHRESFRIVRILCYFVQLFRLIFITIILFSLAITWIIWLAAAAAITQTLGGSLNCATNTVFVYCGQLNALEGFAWLIWWVHVVFVISDFAHFFLQSTLGYGSRSSSS